MIIRAGLSSSLLLSIIGDNVRWDVTHFLYFCCCRQSTNDIRQVSSSFVFTLSVADVSGRKKRRKNVVNINAFRKPR